MSAALSYQPAKPLSKLIFHEVQHRAYGDILRFKVVTAGRRSGKTELAMRRILHSASHPRKKHTDKCVSWRIRMWEHQRRSMEEWECGCPYWQAPYRYFFAAPTQRQATEIAWPWFKRHIPRRFIVNKDETNKVMEIHCTKMGIDGEPIQTGKTSTISILSMEKAQRFEGTKWDGGILDEYGNMREEVWTEHVLPGLSGRDGWCWMIGVPEGMNHYYERYILAQTEENWGSYTWFSADILSAHDIAEARRNLDDKTYRQEYEGSFEEQTGRVYHAFSFKDDVHEFTMPDYVGSEHCPLFIGMDFNVHPMTAVIGYEDVLRADGNVHTFIMHEFELDTSNTFELAEAIFEGKCSCCRGMHGLGFFPAVVHPDASGGAAHTSAKKGVTDHQILRDAGFKVEARTKNPSLRDRFNSTNTRFCTGDGRRRVHIHPRCKRLIRALNGLLFNDKGEPDKTSGFDHITDAFSYAIEFKHEIKRGKVKGMKF